MSFCEMSSSFVPFFYPFQKLDLNIKIKIQHMGYFCHYCSSGYKSNSECGQNSGHYSSSGGCPCTQGKTESGQSSFG